MILYFEDMKTTDAKEKKQFRELSDEELEKVNGGGPLTPTEASCMQPYGCTKFTMDEYGCLICKSY